MELYRRMSNRITATGWRPGGTRRGPGPMLGFRAVDRDFGLTEDQREIVGAVREWVAERAAPAAADFEEKKEFPRDLFAQLGEMGLTGIPYEERFGGGGQPYLTY